jgi:phage shock protein C
MERKILGVCSWLSKKTDIDVTYLRVGFVVAAVVGFGTPVLLYLLLFVLLRLNLLD